MGAINALRDPDAAAEAGARTLPLRHGPGLDVLPEDDLERIRGVTLQILEDTGVGIGSRRSRTTPLYGRDGGRRQRAGSLPLDARRGGAAAGPARDSLLAARDPSCDLRVGGREGWLSTGGRAAMVVDLATDERRRPTTADVAAASRLADARAADRFRWGRRCPRSTSPGSRALHELHAQVANTSKHVQVEIAADAPGARGARRDRAGRGRRRGRAPRAARRVRRTSASGRRSPSTAPGSRRAVVLARGGRPVRVRRDARRRGERTRDARRRARRPRPPRSSRAS